MPKKILHVQHSSFKKPVAATSGASLPVGGAAGDVLTKNSATDGDVIWSAPDSAVSVDEILTGLDMSVVGSTLKVSPGTWTIDFVEYHIDVETDFALAAADPVLYRVDVVYADNLNALHLVQGTASSKPVQPAIPDGTLEVGFVIVAAGGVVVGGKPGKVQANNGLSVSGGRVGIGGSPFVRDNEIVMGGHYLLFSDIDPTGNSYLQISVATAESDDINSTNFGAGFGGFGGTVQSVVSGVTESASINTQCGFGNQTAALMDIYNSADGGKNKSVQLFFAAPGILIGDTADNIGLIGQELFAVNADRRQYAQYEHVAVRSKLSTTDRLASSPLEGDHCYDLTLHKEFCYDGSAWQALW